VAGLEVPELVPDVGRALKRRNGGAGIAARELHETECPQLQRFRCRHADLPGPVGRSARDLMRPFDVTSGGRHRGRSALRDQLRLHEAALGVEGDLLLSVPLGHVPVAGAQLDEREPPEEVALL
jgi:hypothetical protein